MKRRTRPLPREGSIWRCVVHHAVLGKDAQQILRITARKFPNRPCATQLRYTQWYLSRAKYWGWL